MSSNICEQSRVRRCACNHCERLYVHEHIRRVPLFGCKGAALSWPPQIFLPQSLTEATEPGGRERWRDNGNGGRKKANTIFNEFPWLSLPVSGSWSLWLSMWVD